MDPETVVRDFCAAFSRRDVSELLDFFTPDAVYHNMPIAPIQGREGIGNTLRQFVDPQGEAEFEVRAIARSGNLVLTERVDRFVLRGARIELPVMGAFEVTPQGKISAWRDYFDMGQFTKQLGGS
jgi:limonene-1,2-epoxide hydrolase